MMEAYNYETPVFADIFKSYQDFREWYTSTPLSDNENDCPNEKTFTLIAFEYNDSHCSMQVESFKQHFANDIYTYYKEFEETTKALKDLMELTDEEIKVADEFITNFANVPETASSTSIEEVDFISNQQKNINKKGKLQVKREQLSNKRIFTTKTFLKRFKHLFITVVSPSYIPVIGEDEGD